MGEGSHEVGPGEGDAEGFVGYGIDAAAEGDHSGEGIAVVFPTCEGTEDVVVAHEGAD